MKTFVFTTYGSKWAANALAGRYITPDSMYVVYANTDEAVAAGIPNLSINSTISDSLMFTSGSGVGCVSVNFGSYVYGQDTGNTTSAMFSAVLNSDNYNRISGDSPAEGTAKIIGVALIKGDNIIAVCELSTASVWSANTSVSIAIPLSIPAYTQPSTEA